MEVTNMDARFVSTMPSPVSAMPSLFEYGDKFYVVCDGVIINKAAPFATIAEAKSYIESARERDRLELMLHKRLLKKILRKRCSPDLHDYNVVVEVMT